jgi:NhaP-type Na+/H+ or K+/H+ antiporter
VIERPHVGFLLRNAVRLMAALAIGLAASLLWDALDFSNRAAVGAIVAAVPAAVLWAIFERPRAKQRTLKLPTAKASNGASNSS